MANLEHLESFDSELKMAAADIRSLQTLMATQPKTWTNAQALHISKLIGSLGHCINAVGQLVAHNR